MGVALRRCPLRPSAVTEAAAIAAVALLAGAAPLAAQARVRSARMVADLTGQSGPGRVHVEYVLDGVLPGTSVTASVLRFGSARIMKVREGDRDVALRPRQGLASEVSLTALTPDGTGSARVVATYDVDSSVASEGADALRGDLPVLSVDAAPAEALPGLFRAEVILPAAWSVSEAFPTGLASAGADSAGTRRWAVDLPVVPAVVSFRAHTDARWHLGLPLVLDVLAGLILMAFSAVGWRHLKAVAG